MNITIAFNKYFSENINSEYCVFDDELLDGDFNPNYKNEYLIDLYTTHIKASYKGAMFDARCFNVPKEEVANLIYWRQLDATRNSIQMVGQANFSHRELQNKSCNQIQDMLMTQKGINWDDIPSYQKRGSCCIKEEYCCNNSLRSTWIVDNDIPIFKGDNRKYIEDLIYVGE